MNGFRSCCCCFHEKELNGNTYRQVISANFSSKYCGEDAVPRILLAADFIAGVHLQRFEESFTLVKS